MTRVVEMEMAGMSIGQDQLKELNHLRQETATARRENMKVRSLAVAVRLAQARYFDERTQPNLVAAKQAEDALDRELFGRPLTKGNYKDVGNKGS